MDLQGLFYWMKTIVFICTICIIHVPLFLFDLCVFAKICVPPKHRIKKEPYPLRHSPQNLPC